jgi:hypothetical protein
MLTFNRLVLFCGALPVCYIDPYLSLLWNDELFLPPRLLPV